MKSYSLNTQRALTQPDFVFDHLALEQHKKWLQIASYFKIYHLINEEGGEMYFDIDVRSLKEHFKDLLPLELLNAVDMFGAYFYSTDGSNLFELKAVGFSKTPYAKKVDFISNKKEYFIYTYGDRAELGVGDRAELGIDSLSKEDKGGAVVYKKFIKASLLQTLKILPSILKNTHLLSLSPHPQASRDIALGNSEPSNLLKIDLTPTSVSRVNAFNTQMPSYLLKTDSTQLAMLNVRIPSNISNTLHHASYLREAPTNHYLVSIFNDQYSSFNMAHIKKYPIGIINNRDKIYRPCRLFRIKNTENYVLIKLQLYDNNQPYRFQLLSPSAQSLLEFPVVSYWHVFEDVARYILDERSGYKLLHIQNTCPCCAKPEPDDVMHLLALSGEKILLEEIKGNSIEYQRKLDEYKIISAPRAILPSPVDNIASLQPMPFKKDQYKRQHHIDKREDLAEKLFEKLVIFCRDKSNSAEISDAVFKEKLLRINNLYQLLQVFTVLEKAYYFSESWRCLNFPKKAYNQGLKFPFEILLDEVYQLLQPVLAVCYSVGEDAKQVFSILSKRKFISIKTIDVLYQKVFLLLWGARNIVLHKANFLKSPVRFLHGIMLYKHEKPEIIDHLMQVLVHCYRSSNLIDKAIELLTMKTLEGSASFLSHYVEDPKIRRDFIRSFPVLLHKNYPKDKVEDLLMEVISNSQITLAHKIFLEENDLQIIKCFFHFIGENFSSESCYRILSSKNTSGETIGHSIIGHKNEEYIALYWDLLQRTLSNLFFKEENILPKMAGENKDEKCLPEIKGVGGLKKDNIPLEKLDFMYSFIYSLAKTGCYSKLLFSILSFVAKNSDHRVLLNILSEKNEDGATIFHHIMMWYKAEEIIIFMELLKQHLTPKEIVKVMGERGKYLLPAGEYRGIHQDAKLDKYFVDFIDFLKQDSDILLDNISLLLRKAIIFNNILEKIKPIIERYKINTTDTDVFENTLLTLGGIERQPQSCSFYALNGHPNITIVKLNMALTKEELDSFKYIIKAVVEVYYNDGATYIWLDNYSLMTDLLRPNGDFESHLYYKLKYNRMLLFAYMTEAMKEEKIDVQTFINNAEMLCEKELGNKKALHPRLLVTSMLRAFDIDSQVKDAKMGKVEKSLLADASAMTIFQIQVPNAVAQQWVLKWIQHFDEGAARIVQMLADTKLSYVTIGITTIFLVSEKFNALFNKGFCELLASPRLEDRQLIENAKRIAGISSNVSIAELATREPSTLIAGSTPPSTAELATTLTTGLTTNGLFQIQQRQSSEIPIPLSVALAEMEHASSSSKSI